VYLINRAIRRGWISPEPGPAAAAAAHGGSRDGKTPGGVRKTGTPPEVIDPLTVNLALVFAVYLAAYLLLKLITFTLAQTGNIGKDLADGLWGVTFIFAALVAAGVKKLLLASTAARITDNRLLGRIAGSSVDLMVSASIAAISIVVVERYLLPILVLSILGGMFTAVSLLWLCSRMFRDHVFQRTILIFGSMTGTLPTGLALLRVIDPDFRTPASTDYMYAVGLVFIFAVPFIFSMNFPAYGFSRGRPVFYWITFCLYALYLLFVLVAFRVITGRGAFKNPRKIWKD
jgi:ESS family glutamate:Na+ symporter